MSWPFSIRSLLYPQERSVWTQVRIIHETDKAILVDNGRKFWIPKSRIGGIRLKFALFTIYYTWLGMRDLNPRIPGPEPGALPLGHTPELYKVFCIMYYVYN